MSNVTSNNPVVTLLGGYGTTGRKLAFNLWKYNVQANLIIAGRRKGMAQQLVSQLEREHAGKFYLTFTFSHSDATFVELCGNFTEWKPVPMITRSRGSKVEFFYSVALLPGKYHYKFKVNGDKWEHDPEKPFETDNSGNVNNFVEIELRPRLANAEYANVDQPDSLIPLFRKSDLVVMLVNTTPTVFKRVAEIALKEGCDWLDFNGREDIASELENLFSTVQSDSKFLVHAGIAPGLTSTLVNYLGEEVKNDGQELKSVDIGLKIVDAVTSLSSFREIFDDVNLGVKFPRYWHGEWKQEGIFTMTSKKIEFKNGKKITCHMCTPMYMIDLKNTPKQNPSIDNLGVYMAGFHWIFDFFVAPLLLLINMFNCFRPIDTIAHFARYFLALFALIISHIVTPTFEMVVHAQTSETGNSKSDKRNYSLFIHHPRPYELTSLTGVCVIKQYLAKQLRTGYSIAGTVVDPKNFVDDLVDMGVYLEIRQNDAKRLQ